MPSDLRAEVSGWDNRVRGGLSHTSRGLRRSGSPPVNGVKMVSLILYPEREEKEIKHRKRKNVRREINKTALVALMSPSPGRWEQKVLTVLVI